MTREEIKQMVNTCDNYYSCACCPYNPEDISRFIGDRWKGGCPNYDRKLVYAMGKGYGDVSEYEAERELLGSKIKVLEQRLNNKYIEVDNLKRDYHNSLERLKAQEREIERLKAEFKQLETNAEILARGVRDLNHENYELTEKIKQAQIEEIAKFDKLCYDYNKLLYIIRCNMTSITRYVRNENEEYDARYKELAEKAVENILTTINHRGEE